MKKVLLFAAVITLLSALFLPAVSAAAASPSQPEYGIVSASIEYYEDGSYTVTTIAQATDAAGAKGQMGTFTRNAHKDVNHYNSSDELQWSYTIYGTFTVQEGVSSVCTSSTFSYSISAGGWSLTAHNNYYAGNTAYGTATFKKKVLFITTNTVDVNAFITCDMNGNIS